MSVNNTNLLSGRAQLVPYANLTADRYQFLSLNQAEPSLGAGAANSVLTLGTSNTRVWTANLNIVSANLSSNLSVTGNILTSGQISATGNITTTGYFLGTFAGNISGNLTAPGANTQVLYNNNGNAGASGAFTFNQATNAMIVTGNITSGNISISGGNITDANVIFVNTVSAIGNINANIFTGNVASITGNITGGNLIIGNKLIPTTGNINTGNVNINNLSNPVANQDAATKYYVDQSISNIAVTNQTLYGNNVATTFTLDRSTTTAAVLVILNGITQVPDQSYSMSPSPSVNLVFTEAPETGDVIDIRFL
jgi:hypothetical protein